MISPTHPRSFLSPLLCSLYVLLAMVVAHPASAQDDEQPATPATIYHARELAEPDPEWSPLGDRTDEAATTAIEFSKSGAGIEKLQLPGDYEDKERTEQITLQHRLSVHGVGAVPFNAMGIYIDEQFIGLQAENIWHQTATGVFEAFIEDEQANAVARIERRFTLTGKNNYSLIINQVVENLTDGPLTIRMITAGAVDMPKAKTTYAGDRRRIRYGYLLSPEMQQGDLTVVVDSDLKNRSSVLGKKTPGASGVKMYDTSAPVWPTEKTAEHGKRLSWVAMSDRYFVVLTHPVFDPLQVTTPEEKLMSGIQSVDRLVLNPGATAQDAEYVLRFNGQQVTIQPGEQYEHTQGVYAGPRTKPVFSDDPLMVSLNVPSMVVYNLGGFCAPCTFQWLTGILISVLRLFHSISGDWAVSIIMLVLLVRTCLHPISRWSQIRMQRFGVQMQSMAPKQKAIREKYKSDPKRQQAEMSKLWREEGISPTGMLGCLPMFLQSPVFIALYATLFFAVELRHEPAFYGVFQAISGGSWHFLYDLSMPDGAIPLPSSMHFSFPLWGTVTSINILPLLLGVVFFAHQKYLTPPTQATTTPEQASQQKMMKIMMVVMFPLMMYTAPSGLSLYFITNSTVAIFENKWIRSHMNKHGMLDIDNIRASKKDKGPGFLQRMSEAAEAQRQLKEKGPRPPNPNSRNNRPH